MQRMKRTIEQEAPVAGDALKLKVKETQGGQEMAEGLVIVIVIVIEADQEMEDPEIIVPLVNPGGADQKGHNFIHL